MTQTLPLTVFRDTTGCGGQADHELTLITDGFHAYAYGPHTDAVVSYRDLDRFHVHCNQPGRNDEPCGGVADFVLSTMGTWTTDPDAIRTLSKFGETVES